MTMDPLRTVEVGDVLVGRDGRILALANPGDNPNSDPHNPGIASDPAMRLPLRAAMERNTKQ